MTKLTVTLDLDNDANPSLLKKMIKNMKGVVKVSVHKNSYKNSTKTGKLQKDEWLEELHNLIDGVDRSVVDLNDEKTRHILSK